MVSKIHVKTDDTVIVRTGKDKGKTGKVMKTFPKDGRVIVSGVNIVFKHQKARGQDKPAGRVEREGSIASSNVMLVCPKCSQATRLARKVNKDKSKIRVCKKCGASVDSDKKTSKEA